MARWDLCSTLGFFRCLLPKIKKSTTRQLLPILTWNWSSRYVTVIPTTMFGSCNLSLGVKIDAGMKPKFIRNAMITRIENSRLLFVRPSVMSDQPFLNGLWENEPWGGTSRGRFLGFPDRRQSELVRTSQHCTSATMGEWGECDPLKSDV